MKGENLVRRTKEKVKRERKEKERVNRKVQLEQQQTGVQE